MAKFKMVSEQPLTIAEVNDELQKIKKRDAELSFRAGKTEDYINIFQGLDSAKGKALFNAIQKLDIPRLKEVHIAKIVDLRPTNPDELKSILSAYTISVTADNLKKIVAVVEEHSAKKEKKKKEEKEKDE